MTFGVFDSCAVHLDPVQLAAEADGIFPDDVIAVHTAALRGLSGASTALPHAEAIQRSFGPAHDVSGIRAHVGGPATEATAAMGATAYATGDSVAFATAPDLHTAAHEAAHIVQQRAGVQLYGGVGQAGDPYEQHADAVAARAGHSAADLLAAGPRGGSTTSAVQRFDAGSGGHQGLERSLAGLDPNNGLGQPDNLKKPAPAAGTREHGANAIYAGNFMQDFSQMHAPFVHNMLAKMPRRPVDAARGKASPTIGDAGATAVTNSIIRALAILDVGPALADQIIAGNMQAYRPEQHVDQPMGYAANTDALVHDRGRKDKLRPGRRTVQGGDYPASSKLDVGRSTNVTKVADPDRDRDLAGAAVPGRQLENPDLFKVSDAGLQVHIYNSIEWCKNHWLAAARLGPTDQGRFHIGSGLHVIEDYFSHSNFIEVALNEYISSAIQQPKKSTAAARTLTAQVGVDGMLGRGSRQRSGKGNTLVDTLYDQRQGQRLAVITGSVSGIDMKGSIGHILLPKAPLLQSAIDGAVEKIFNLTVDDPGEISTWAKLKAVAEQDRPMAAVLALGEGLDQAGMTLPTPTGVDLAWGALEIPVPFADDPTFEYPTDATIRYGEQPITQSVGAYLGFVKAAHEAISVIEVSIGTIMYMGPAGYAAAVGLRKLIEYVHESITNQLKLLKDRAKQQLSLGIVTLIDRLSGVDVRDEKTRTIGDAVADAHDRVEGFEHQTSLQARLLPGGDLAGLSAEELAPIVGAVVPADEGGWRAVGPLAPSHSEISKDHAPYTGLHLHGHGNAIRNAVDLDQEEGRLLNPDQHMPGVEHDHREGSIFGGLARALATEADRHVLRQVEIMWADRGSLYGDGKPFDASGMQVEHEQMTSAASTRSAESGKMSKAAGFTFAQHDQTNADILGRPGVRQLIDLVDLLIAHPMDAGWWRPVVDAYVAGHPFEVARHIRERNATRGQRREIAS